LQGILDAGFDGVYIDWVEAYDDELVANKALADCNISPNSAYATYHQTTAYQTSSGK